MLAASLTYLVNLIIFIGYLLFWKNKTAMPETFLLIYWIPFIVHVWFHHFADGYQNTTRNIARIYLIKNNGVAYDNQLVAPIQTALVPNSFLIVTFFWYVIHIVSFAILLFFQGWATALVAEFGLFVFGGVLPIKYQSHLKRVQKHMTNIGFNESLPLHLAGISIEDLKKLVNQAILEHRNPQQWWAIVLHDETQKILREKITRSDS